MIPNTPDRIIIFKNHNILCKHILSLPQKIAMFRSDSKPAPVTANESEPMVPFTYGFEKKPEEQVTVMVSKEVLESFETIATMIEDCGAGAPCLAPTIYNKDKPLNLTVEELKQFFTLAEVANSQDESSFNTQTIRELNLSSNLLIGYFLLANLLHNDKLLNMIAKHIAQLITEKAN